ncbi:MAG TPA: MauE/DoxX family redox-associated membrane protein [Actinomycetota bacterium]|nr:MauE/DoxX family redox-associated membrane protein [Actinomycetota bacterium]
MDSLVLGLRLVLAGVFATAGVAKLMNLTGSRRALEDFGVPVRLARPGGVLLPLFEIAIAASLLLPFSAQWGALAAAGLLGAFIVVIANALAHGRAPDCHCFGQLHSEPAGWSTLARNGVLVGLAAAVAALGPGPAVPDWIAERSALDLAILTAALAAVAFGAFRVRAWKRRRQRNRYVQSVIDGIDAEWQPPGKPVGSAAPPFALRGVRGENVTLESLCARGRPVVLVFFHPRCGPCRQLLPDLGEWQATLAQSLTVAVLSEGDVAANRPLTEEHDIDNFLLQEGREVYLAYEVRAGTPAAVVVDPDGSIAGPTVGGRLAIEELIRLTLSRSESPGQPSLAG